MSKQRLVATPLFYLLVALVIFLCLFGNSSDLQNWGVLGSVLRELAAIFRDSGTQWMVFLCVNIYCVAFLFLRHRRNGQQFFRSDNPIFWLAVFLVLVAGGYYVGYTTASRSTQALTLAASIALGLGLQVCSNWHLPKSRWIFLTPTMLICFLLVAAFWQPESFRGFEYRGRSRLSGLWDNPNVFGLLMGAGVIIAIGLAVGRWNAADGRWKMEVGRRKLGLKNRTGIVLCFVAAMLMGRGLFQSFSRGAWLATLVGVGYLLLYWVRNHSQRPESSNLGIEDLKTPTLDSDFPKHGSGSRIMHYASRYWFPTFIFVFSLMVVSFWHLRDTEWHPARRVFSVGNANDFSWRNRVAAWEGAFQMMADKPLLGMGWNLPERTYENYYRMPKISEGMAIQMNDYLMLGATLGVPALVCFGMYLWLSLTQRGARAPAFGAGMPATGWKHCSTLDQVQATCRAGAIVLLVGFWFDGGLFKLATGSVFWVLLELGRRDLIHPEETKEAELTTIESSRTPA